MVFTNNKVGKAINEEIDVICEKLSKENANLLIENDNLKAELDRVQCDECMNLQDENAILKKSNEELVGLCAKLKQENYVMSGLLNGEEKEIVKKLQKLQDMQNECDTCIRQDCEVARLQSDLKEANEKLAEKERDYEYVKNKWEDVCKNAKPLQYLNREEVEKIIKNFICKRDTIRRKKYIEGITYDEQSAYRENHNEAITAILDLAIKVDRDRIVEIIKGYFYMTVDSVEYNKNSHDSYIQNVARIYSQKEIETEEDYMTDKLKEELTREYISIANEIIKSIGGNDV